MAGENIDFSCKHTLELAKKGKCRVMFKFNDIKLEATPNKSLDTLKWKFNNILGQKSEAYRVSKKGQDSIKARKVQVSEKQEKIDFLIRDMGFAMFKMDVLMDWLYNFTEVADDIDVKYNSAEIIKVLESKYVENAYVGDPPNSFNNKDKMGKYIIGQAINNLKSGMPPHSICMKFIEDYRKLA